MAAEFACSVSGISLAVAGVIGIAHLGLIA